MNETLNQEQLLRDELEGLLRTLKNNRENVPLGILKSRYKTGYDNLCKKISTTATCYAKQVVLHDIRIHHDYMAEGTDIISKTIQDSGLLVNLSEAAFRRQDISEFTIIATTLRDKILAALEPFYESHTVLYISSRCLGNSNIVPYIYCLANNCIWYNETWTPLEQASQIPVQCAATVPTSSKTA